MARIRTIKPDFWTDEKIVECSIEARLFFIGSWNFADDNGNLPRSPKKLKMQVFPADSFDCEPLIQELITHGLLIEYSVNGTAYLNIAGFKRHQLINRPSKSQIPDYIPNLPSQSLDEATRFNDCSVSEPPHTRTNSMSAQAKLSEDSLNAHGVLTEPSLTEGRGKDMDKEKDIKETVILRGGIDTTESVVREEKSVPPSSLTTRKGELSKILRKIGIDAAPHHVAWTELLKHSDESILACAEIAKSRKPDERLPLNYLLPMLKDVQIRGSPSLLKPAHKSLNDRAHDWVDRLNQVVSPVGLNDEVIDVEVVNR